MARAVVPSARGLSFAPRGRVAPRFRTTAVRESTPRDVPSTRGAGGLGPPTFSHYRIKRSEGRFAVHRRARSASLIGAAATVAVVATACGQYPGVHRDPVVRDRPGSATTAQPPASPVSGIQAPPAAARGADGATGPGAHAIKGGGGKSVDLTKIFPVQHPGSGSTTNSGSGSKQGAPPPTGTSKGSTSGTKGSSTGGSKSSTTGSSKSGSSTGGAHQGSGSPSPSGEDGANPGPPDIKGQVTPGKAPTGSLDLATLVSRETVQGAKYNSTVLPKGFPLLICPVQGKYSYSDSYGAPRYAGGYHPHAGVDIFADQGTPIVAPFDGYVSREPNTLGGNAV